MKFQDMRDRVYLDKKWLREKERYHFLPEEKELTHCVQHKSHRMKVMFVCAVARPRFNPCANFWWDGKLGIWPIGKKLAKQKSVNRPKETLVWKNKTVTKEVYQDLLITNLLPVIIHSTRWGKKSHQ